MLNLEMIYLYTIYSSITYSFPFYRCESVAKQRIDSGFFLFEAEMKKKKEKKQI